MVNKTKTTSARERAGRPAAGGRPPIDPADLRSDHLGLRMHPDLRGELDRLARFDGMKVSMWVERTLIAAVNARLGTDAIDLIGRYKTDAKQSRR